MWDKLQAKNILIVWDKLQAKNRLIMWDKLQAKNILIMWDKLQAKNILIMWDKLQAKNILIVWDKLQAKNILIMWDKLQAKNRPIMWDKLQAKNILIIQDRNKTNETLSEAPNTNFNLNPLCSFGGEIYSFVKLLCYPTERPKYSTRIERDPATIMTEENSVESTETIKNNPCEYKLPAEKLHQLIKRRVMWIRYVEPMNGSNLKRHTILVYDVCLTMHHWYTLCRRPTRCNNNNLLIFQKAQHVSGNFFAHPQERKTVLQHVV